MSSIDSQPASKNQSTSWRETLPVHPEADLYPLWSKTDPAALRKTGEDIRENGLKVPIVILREGDPLAGPIDRNDRANYKLIDGRNRLDAMEAVGVHFKLVWKKGANDWNWTLVAPDIALPEKGAVDTVLQHDDPAALVASLNLHRRHLTVAERHEKLVRMLTLHPEKSDRAIAADLKVDKNVVSRARKKVAATGAGAPVEKRIGRDGKSRRTPKRATPEFKLTFRMEKLGDDYARIVNTSLHAKPEMDALIALKEASPEQGEALIARAEAGETVSAVAAVAALKQTPAPMKPQPMSGPEASTCEEELDADEAREAQAKAAQDIGENSSGEAERLRVRVEEQNNEIQRLRNILEEVEKLDLTIWSENDVRQALAAYGFKDFMWAMPPDWVPKLEEWVDSRRRSRAHVRGLSVVIDNTETTH